MAAKRPLLPKADRNRLAYMAGQAGKAAHRDSTSPNRAYAKGVEDALLWLVGFEPTPLFEEVTR